MIEQDGGPMRRKTNKDILKENIGILILSALFLLLGLALPFLPQLTAVEYDQLYEKEIIIDSLKWISGYRGAGGHFRITTANGERYNVSGDYTGTELRNGLQSGTKASIKYHENRFLFLKYAEEVVVDGKCIVQYNDDQKPHPLIYMVSGFFVLFGILGFLYVRWNVKHNRRIQKNRDQRIIKKYGSLNKHTKKRL